MRQLKEQTYGDFPCHLQNGCVNWTSLWLSYYKGDMLASEGTFHAASKCPFNSAAASATSVDELT